ncbi:hypothetical protein EB74_07330 [Mycobacterium sp. SWH-M5]|nr:hypothetical protein EB74_07330 [Mycobacterium sp. SWH-M5]
MIAGRSILIKQRFKLSYTIRGTLSCLYGRVFRRSDSRWPDGLEALIRTADVRGTIDLLAFFASRYEE